MKKSWTISFTLLSFMMLFQIQQAEAQFLKRLKDRVQRSAENTVIRKAEQTTAEKTDQVLDSVFTPGSEGQGGKEPQGNEEGTVDPSNEGANEGNSNIPNNEHSEQEVATDPQENATPLMAYTKYDFVGGEQLIGFEDFSEDEIGDLPARWNSSSSIEVVKLNNAEGKWIKIGIDPGTYVPEFISEIPDNFTLEFDLIFDFDIKAYGWVRYFGILFSDLENPNYDLTREKAGENLLTLEIDHHRGGTYRKVTPDRQLDATNQKSIAQLEKNSTHRGKPMHVAIWRQKTRMRMYVEGVKIFDLPRAFEKETKLNTIRFFSRISNPDEYYYVSNIRYAVGKPDMRSKLIEEGRLITYGITFDVNSANIKPESVGTLKSIAQILTDNPEVKVLIEGHTDSDGTDEANLTLSEKRAKAVKEALVSQFNVTSDQLSTVGKGETELLVEEDSPESKAKNRRVEFIKQ